MKVDYKCIHCGNIIYAEKELTFSAEIECPGCGEILTSSERIPVPSKGKNHPDKPEAPAVVKNSQSRYKCAYCGNIIYTEKEISSSRKIECNGCGRTLTSSQRTLMLSAEKNPPRPPTAVKHVKESQYQYKCKTCGHPFTLETEFDYFGDCHACGELLTADNCIQVKTGKPTREGGPKTIIIDGIDPPIKTEPEKFGDIPERRPKTKPYPPRPPENNLSTAKEYWILAVKQTYALARQSLKKTFDIIIFDIIIGVSRWSKPIIPPGNDNLSTAKEYWILAVKQTYALARQSLKKIFGIIIGVNRWSKPIACGTLFIIAVISVILFRGHSMIVSIISALCAIHWGIWMIHITKEFENDIRGWQLSFFMVVIFTAVCRMVCYAAFSGAPFSISIILLLAAAITWMMLIMTQIYKHLNQE